MAFCQSHLAFCQSHLAFLSKPSPFAKGTGKPAIPFGKENALCRVEAAEPVGSKKHCYNMRSWPSKSERKSIRKSLTESRRKTIRKSIQIRLMQDGKSISISILIDFEKHQYFLINININKNPCVFIDQDQYPMLRVVGSFTSKLPSVIFWGKSTWPDLWQGFKNLRNCTLS